MPLLSGGQVTRLWPYGGPGGQYGDFNGKTVAPGGTKTYTATFTQHGSGGGIASPYGSFAGKSPGVPFELSAGTIALTGTAGVVGTSFSYQVNWDFEPPLQITPLVGVLQVTGGFFYNSVGTLTVTLTGAASTGSGTTTIVGTTDVLLNNDTLAASGEQELIDGTVEIVLSDDVSAIQGSPDITGTLTVTLSNDTLVSSGGAIVAGTLAVTVQNDYSSSYGLVGDPPTGSASKLPIMGVGS